MSLFAVLLALVPSLLGIIVVSALQLAREKVALVLLGILSGLAAFTTLVYAATLFVTLSSTLLATLLAVAIIGIAVVSSTTKAWHYWWQQPLDRIAVTIVLLAVALFSIIAPKLLIEQNGELSTGIINAYGDIAWHMSNITAFAEGQSIPPENPIFADTRLTYPFLSNFFSATLLTAGAGFAGSVALPGIVLIPLLLGLLYVLTREVVPTEGALAMLRRPAAIVAVLLFVCGGASLGWVRIFADWQESNQSLTTFITHLPARDYSGVGTDEQGFHFLNPVTTLLLPQRAFLFGLPLAIAIALLLLPRPEKRAGEYVMAGILAGLLPLFHAHTTIALLPVIIGLFVLQPNRYWLYFFLAGALIGLPEIAYYVGNTAESGSFMRFEPGWTAGDRNILWFWWINTGLLIPVGLLSLKLPVGRPVKVLVVAGACMWLLANLFLFAPWAWDNFKLLVYWLVWSLPAIALAAAYMWQRFPRLHVRVLIALLVGAHLLSGALDTWKISLPTAAIWNEWDAPGIAFAEEVKRVTQPRDNILTAPIHNTPVVLAGRPLYLGYAAHVWSHGELPWDRENAIQLFYEGTSDTLPEAAPAYVVVGPVEQSKYRVHIRPTWQLVVNTGTYQLYRL